MNASSPRRVVVTGLGLISPLGNSPETLWDGLVSGRSGVARLQSLPADSLPTPFGAECREFTGEIENFGPLEKMMQRNIKKGLKVMCREIQMGVAAAQLALHHAGLDASKRTPERTGVVYGSDYIITEPDDFTDGIRNCIGPDGRFDFSKWADQGLPKVDPLWLLKYLPNMPASHIAIYNELRGPSNSITLREASANLAIGEAFATIMRGSADVMLAGATGTRIHPLRTLHTILQEQVTTEDRSPETLSRPFDKDRAGMVLGEGAGAILLEDLQSAQTRGATIYGEVVGHGSSAVLDQDRVANYGLAIRNSIAQALRSAGMQPNQIGHIHAHGISTVKCDAQEATAIQDLFGPNAKTPVVAAKSHFGNLGAGSGIVELIASIMAINANRLFPVLNYETPDPACPVTVSRTGDAPAGNSVVNVNVTPFGQASAVIVKRFVA